MITTEDETVKVIVATLCITALEAIALILGIDGAMLTIVVAALAGLGGYEVAKKKLG